MSISKAVGPCIWEAMHWIAILYPHSPSDEQKKSALEFCTCFQHLFPCTICSMHYRALLVTHPPQVKNKTEFIKWTREIHNAVNRNTNKKEWSHEDFMVHYQKKIRMALDNNFSRSVEEDYSSQQEAMQQKEAENQELRNSLSAFELEKKRILDIQLRERLQAHSQKRCHDRTRTNLLVVIAATVLVLMMVLGAWFFSYRRWYHNYRKLPPNKK